MPARTIWTIGHSTRPWEAFAALLSENDIRLLVDVRSFPGSRRHPQFGKETMAGALPPLGVAYRWMPALGGRRKPQPDSPHTAWRHPAFRGYADYMDTPAFAAGLAELEAAAAKERTAVMCSEAVWWRCHRGLISDALKVRGWTVMHIEAPGRIREHPYTPPARVEANRLNY